VRRPLVSLVLSGVVLLAACGSSGSSASDSTTTTKPALTSTDRRIGRAALLRAADLPGYQEVTAQQSVLADLTDAATGETACRSYLQGKQRRLGTGRGAGFQNGHTVVDSSLAVFPDEATAQSELELFRAPTMAKCLEAVYAPKGASVAAAPVDVGGLGDDRVAYRITRTDQSSDTAISVIVVRVGRVLLSASITGPAADTTALEQGAITKAVDRVRAAEA
jgi:hypothetical protein